MAYNFKSIADVEVVAKPAESANVLIEENGVIKKAPKDEIGAKEEWDLDLSITLTNDSEGNISHEYVVSNKKSFEEIKNKIVNGLPLNNKIAVAFYSSNSGIPFYTMSNMWYGYYPAGSEGSDSPEYIYFEIDIGFYIVVLLLNPDDTVVDDT